MLCYGVVGQTQSAWFIGMKNIIMYNTLCFFTVSDDVAKTLRDLEERLREHDVTLRKKSIDVTSLQHQLFGVLRKGAARDEAISSIQQSIGNASLVGVSLGFNLICNFPTVTK